MKKEISKVVLDESYIMVRYSADSYKYKKSAIANCTSYALDRQLALAKALYEKQNYYEAYLENAWWDINSIERPCGGIIFNINLSKVVYEYEANLKKMEKLAKKMATGTKGTNVVKNIFSYIREAVLAIIKLICVAYLFHLLSITYKIDEAASSGTVRQCTASYYVRAEFRNTTYADIFPTYDFTYIFWGIIGFFFLLQALLLIPRNYLKDISHAKTYKRRALTQKELFKNHVKFFKSLEEADPKLYQNSKGFLYRTETLRKALEMIPPEDLGK